MKNMTDDQYINEICNILKEKSEKDYDFSTTKRGAHSKSIGLLKAKFIVSDKISDALKLGILKSPKAYDCLIRISSSSPKIQGDNKKDILGFSIKLLDVDGKKLINDELSTQDFLLISAKTMPIGTLKLFYEAIYYNIKVNPVVYFLNVISQGNIHKLKEIASFRKHHTSPLDIEYFSTTPYSFGNRAVKYSIVPTSKYKSSIPKKPTSKYLSLNMQNHLHKSIATFDFMIQFKKDNMPIEDASIEWDETISPFIKVGEIVIDKQNFITKDRYNFCENLSFSPAHSLIEHKPLGSLNRARSIIYFNMSKFRHIKNNQPKIEPNSMYFKELK
ncbi:MAG: hypothetical protein RRZ84_04920 [Romboutsia sp.]